MLVDYIGIPYAPRGRDIKAIDCWGLCLLYSANELGKELPAYMYDLEDGDDVAAKQMQENTALGGRWSQVDIPQHGDILVFRILGASIHCGIYLRDGDFLHTIKGRTSCIENLKHIDWVKRLTGVYRFNG